MSDTTTEIPTKGNSKLRMILGITGGLIVGGLVAWGASNWMVFRAQAEGLALGYAEAATTAYQMDRYARPLPDRIFETGNYRVETRTNGNPPKLSVSVRDRFVNVTHYQLERDFEVAGRPQATPLTPEGR